MSGQVEPRLVIPKIVIVMAPDGESCVDQASVASSPCTLRKKPDDDIETVIDHDYRYSHFLLGVPKPMKVSRKHMIGSEQEITESELILAATLVHEAMEGRNAKFKTERTCVTAYRLYKKWPLTVLLYLAILINLSLVIFEEPAVESLALDYPVTMSIEVVCLMYFVFRTAHQFYWRSRQQFLRDIKNVIVIIIIVLTLIDMVVYAVRKNVTPDAKHIRVSRALRAVIIVNLSDGRQIRRAWRNMRRTFKDTIHVVALFYFFIFVFALIAYKIFAVRQDITFPKAKPYFKNYMDSVWEMYVLVTTSNNPDVILPAFKESRFYCIFFSVYIFVCFYIFLNVFLAVAYHSFNANIMDEIKCSIDAKKGKIQQAFEVIKINKNGHDMVTYKTWKRLMNLVLPKLSKNQIDLLMLVLNTKCSGYIDRSEFMHVADLLNVPISEVNDRITWLEMTFPSVYLSFASKRIKTVVQTIYFSSVYDMIVIIEVFLIGFDVPGIDIPFSVLFILEIGLKVYTYGPLKYFKRPRNWFDVIITALCFMFLVLDTVIQSDHNTENIFKETTQAVNIIRIFRILRLLFRVKRFKTIINTLMNVSLSVLVYCVIVFIFVYIFNVIGMELFKGRIQPEMNATGNNTDDCGTKELEDSEFADAHYCDLNFNDFISSTFVVASLLFENNWHRILLL